MKPDILRDHVLSYLSFLSNHECEGEGEAFRTAREIAKWIGNGIGASEVDNALLELESAGLVERSNEVPVKGNSAYWRVPHKRAKNTLVVIGYLGGMTAYLNVSEEAALKRYLEKDWPEGWDDATEADTRAQMRTFEFEDHFNVYDASPAD